MYALAHMANTGRWDRSVLKHIAKRPGARQEVERRLAAKEKGLSISKRLGFPKSTWVSACKKNPLPGGPLDRKGKLAAYLGEWVDEGGLVRPWKGLDAKGRPRLFSPIEKTKGGTHAAEGDLIGEAFKTAGKDKGKHKVKSSKKTLPFKTAVRPPEKVQSRGADDADKSVPQIEEEEAGAVVVAEGESEDDPIEAHEAMLTRGASVSAAKLKRLAHTALSIADRIKLLATLAQNTDQPQVALRAIQELNKLDGTEKKHEEGRERGNAPLFGLPKGTRVSFSPVGPAVDEPGEIEEEYPEEDDDDGTGDTGALEVPGAEVYGDLPADDEPNEEQ